jgi:hypothetical protein
MSLERSLEEMLIKATIVDSTHNIEAALVEIDAVLTELNRKVANLYIAKGSLLERLRTIKIMDDKLLHHSHIVTENPETTQALQALHRVNAEHTGC